MLNSYHTDFIASLTEIRGLSENTARAYNHDIQSYLDWAERAGVDPLTISHRQLRMYLSDLGASKYSRTTIARKMACLRSFFEYLITQKVIEQNPAALLSSPKLPSRLPKALPDSEVVQLLDIEFPDTPKGLRDAALLETLYASGMRVAEASSLKINDINFSAGNALVTGKGSKQRLVPIHPFALLRLRDYINQARPSLSSASSSDSLFLSTRGNPLSTDAIRRIVNQAATSAGLSAHVSPHTLRHSFATDMLNNDTDLRTVQEFLGHSNLSTTQIYTHISGRRLQDIHHRSHPRG